METVTQHKVVEDLRSVSNDVRELVKAKATETAERIGTARARAEASMRGAQARLAQAGQEVSTRAHGAARATDRYVHEKPWRVLGVAAGLGFLIGCLLARR